MPAIKISISKLNCDNIMIYADERKLEELFLNLVINGIQSIERADGNIEINCKKEGKICEYRNC